MRHRYAFAGVAAVVFALALAPALAAETIDTDGLSITAVDTTDHPEVRVTVSASRDQVGPDLPAEAFSLTEGGQDREVAVQTLPPDERQVVVAIDASGSMGVEPMEAAKAAAATFVQRLPEGTRAAVIEFSADARVVSPLSADVAAHVAAIGGMSADGGTALYDAIAASLEQFEGGDGQALVLLSDGGDTESALALDQIEARVRASGATLYIVGLETEATDTAALQRLALAGNGRVVSATEPAQLASMYDIIAEDIIAAEPRDNYLLTYRSNVRGPVDLSVVVAHQAGLSEVTSRVTMPSPPVVAFAPSILASPWTLAVGAAMVFIAIGLLMLVALWPGEVRSILSVRRAHDTTGAPTIPGMASLANRATLVVDRALTRRSWTPSLNASLERAAIALRPAEFVLLTGCAVITAFAAGLLFGGFLLGLMLSAVVVIVAFLGLKALGERRRARFADQLGETLQLLSGSLRAGYSLLQAVDAVAREADSPTAEEFRRIVVETRLGRELDDALEAMDNRIGSEDLQWVVQAITIHREVGGDLAQVLDTVAGTIRERNQIRRQVKALSAEGKLSAIVLYGLPFGVAGFVALTNPSYLAPLVREPMGWAMLAVGGLLLAVGGVWLRKVVRITF
ncbi:MAG TPA: type II secretion system F family protein [Egibacteraceae bacterium]|nr:type II secretion system F family protein [Egibacteraceae bacterium]